MFCISVTKDSNCLLIVSCTYYVLQERPQLESERSQLLDSIANDQQVVLDLENKTLSLLHKSEGHILDDKDLVQTLEQSKTKAAEIKLRILQSETTERHLNVARKRYLPVAIRGSVLYFVIADLSGVDVMYQFSLEWFQTMFINCITSHGEDESDMRWVKPGKTLLYTLRVTMFLLWLRCVQKPRNALSFNLTSYYIIVFSSSIVRRRRTFARH